MTSYEDREPRVVVTDEMVERAARAMAQAGVPQDDWGPLTQALVAALYDKEA